MNNRSLLPLSSSPRAARLLRAAWLVLLASRLLLPGRGALADSDEARYRQSWAALAAAGQGNWREMCYALSSTAGRPADAVWRLLPAAGQQLLRQWLGWSLEDPRSLLVPVLGNVLTVTASAWMFYRICQRLLAAEGARRDLWALLAAVLYAGLANTNLYVRHVLPYDSALLVFFGLLNVVLQQSARPSVGFFGWLGVGAGLLFLLYPGYYAGPVLLLAPLLPWQPARLPRRYAGRVVVFGLGAGLPLLAAEALSRAGGGPPYWAVAYDLSRGILQGAPEEGYSFLGKYLLQVEGPLGALLLLLLFLALCRVPLAPSRLGRLSWAGWRPRSRRARLLAAAAVLFLAHATAAAMLHRIVWYGRLLHLYLPLLVLAGVAALAATTRAWPARRITALALAGAALSLGSFGLFLRGYLGLAYPPNVLWDNRVGALPPGQVRHLNEVRVAPGMLYPLPLPGPGPVAEVGDSLTVLLNCAHLYPLTAATRLPPVVFGPGARVLFDGPYYDAFRPYTFDGLAPAERAEAARRRFRVRIVRVPRAAASTLP